MVLATWWQQCEARLAQSNLQHFLICLQAGAGKKPKAAKAAPVDKENGGLLNVLSAAAAREQQAEEAAQAGPAAKLAAVPKSQLERRPLGALSDRCAPGWLRQLLSVACSAGLMHGRLHARQPRRPRFFCAAGC